MSVLLIAHGSPDPRHSAAIESFAQQVQEASGFPTTVGYLEHNTPSVEAALGNAIGSTTSAASPSVSAVGLFLASGYHVRVDVPRVLADAGPAVIDCGPLGLGDWLLPALDRALGQTLAGDGDSDTDGSDGSDGIDGADGVALVATGSSRPEARDEVVDLAARWEEKRRAPVRAAFATGPGTTIDEAMIMLNQAGCQRRVVMPLLLAPGSMADRVIESARRKGTPVSAPLLGAPLLSQVPAPPELLTRVLHLVSVLR